MPLRLLSAGAPLTLEDGVGRSWKAASFTVRWESVALLNPLTLARRIAGPFASFESAERLAQRWRAMGVTASVAHPNEWEVWAPQGSIAPEDTPVRDWISRVHATVEPTLETPEGLQPIKGSLLITAPDGLLWNSGVFRGPFRLQRDAYGSWTLIEQVAVERYLEGVVPHEIGASSPVSALEAQTVLARTWALANSHRFNIDGYHLCSDTQCPPRKKTQLLIAIAKDEKTWRVRATLRPMRA
jgi:peptidoglycan hydrolase-like amidase